MWRDGGGSRYSVDCDVTRQERGGVEEEEADYEDEANPKSSICCLQGCLAATAVGFSFFVGLPTGILLVVYASNNDDIALVSAGTVLVALPLVMLIIVTILCLNQRRLARLRKLGKNKVTSSTRRRRSSRTNTSPAASAAAVVTVGADTVSISTATTTNSTISSNEGSPQQERF